MGTMIPQEHEKIPKSKTKRTLSLSLASMTKHTVKPWPTHQNHLNLRLYIHLVTAMEEISQNIKTLRYLKSLKISLSLSLSSIPFLVCLFVSVKKRSDNVWTCGYLDQRGGQTAQQGSSQCLKWVGPTESSWG